MGQGGVWFWLRPWRRYRHQIGWQVVGKRDEASGLWIYFEGEWEQALAAKIVIVKATEPPKWRARD